MTRIKSITGIKIIALLGIFIWHTGIISSPDLGARGCEIFFVCSGFCMGYNYYKKGIPDSYGYSFSFVWRKIKQFYPLHFITFIMAAVYLIRWGSTKHMLAAALTNLLLLQSWFKPIMFSYNWVAWFLSSLIVCYFFTPCILYLIRRMNNKLWLLFTIFFLIRLFMEMGVRFAPDVFSYSMHTNPIVRLWEYAMACVAGVYFIRIKDKKQNNNFIISSIAEAAVSAGYLASVVLLNGKLWRVGFVIIVLATIFVFSFDGGLFSKILGCRLFSVCALIEMEFYMFHSVAILYTKLLVSGTKPAIATAFVLTIICSVVYRLLYNTIHNKITAKQT